MVVWRRVEFRASQVAIDEVRVVDEREKLFGRERETDEGFDGKG